MTNRKGGSRKGTRHKFAKRARDRGKLTIAQILKTFKIGERARIKAEPSIQKGLPHQRFHNLVGTIIKKKGGAYVVEIKDGKKTKQVVTLPVHMVKL